MLSLARTSKYVNDTSVLSIRKSEEDRQDWKDSPNLVVILVINLYVCFSIELLCQTKTFMQLERLNRLTEHLHEIDWL